ncbi:MAG: lysylphosphatidylglycerol synthase transmembrane domain-containing protein [Gammaproteobacteria bacterium]|nr:lysylphosphatidylglycerol synthase transmembrane domain-containing protein [Gammaproteobacteria bacterium]
MAKVPMLSHRMKLGLGLLALLAFILFIQYYIGWIKLLTPWQQVAVPTLLLIMSQVLFSYAIRARRLYGYFKEEMRGRFAQALKLMLQHNLANNFLPMRSGEVAFPVLMSRYFSVPLTRSVPALLWFRVFDLHTLVLLGLGALGSHWLDPYQLGFVGVVWLILPWWLFMANRWLLEKVGSETPGRISQLLHKLLDGAPKEKRLLLMTWFWTLLNWSVKLLAFVWLLILFADITTAQALLGVIGGELTSVLPVHGIAGAGTYEAGIVAALLPFGIRPEPALSAAVNLHLFLLGVTLIGGVLSLTIGDDHVG